MKPDPYAQALLTLVKQGEKPKEVTARMNALLTARGHTALIPRIVRTLQRLAQRDMKKHRSLLYVAKKGSERSARVISGASSAEVVVDETLVGGWRLEEGERLTDASWKRHLLALYNLVTQ